MSEMQTRGDPGRAQAGMEAVVTCDEKSQYGSYRDDYVLGSARAVTCTPCLAPVYPAPTCLPISPVPPSLAP